MKDEKIIKEMYELIGFFNDGKFMNQDYRNGLMDALSFTLYNQTYLDRLKDKLGTEILFNEEKMKSFLSPNSTKKQKEKVYIGGASK